MSEEANKAVERGRRMITGRVVSDKMDKTVSVSVDRLIRHPKYGKFIRRTTKVFAHDQNNDCKAGDRVTITECRPISRHKAWKVVEIVERAPEE